MTEKPAGVRRYSFRAIDVNGSTVHGVRLASDASKVSDLLVRDGLFPVTVDEDSSVLRWRGRTTSSDNSAALSSLATLLSAGLTLNRALGAFETIAPNSWRDAVTTIRARIREGATLSMGISESGIELDKISLELIRAGEAGGDLAGGMRAASEYATEREAVKAAMTAALAYPALLFVAASASAALLLGVVVPRFAVLIADNGATLPRSTAVAMQLASTIRVTGPWLAVTGCVLIASPVILRRDERYRAKLDALLLRVPGLGLVRRLMASSRTAGTTSALLRGGATLPAALTHAARASGNDEIQARVTRARERIVRGSLAAAALESEEAVSDTVVRFVRVGEETGELAEMLRQAARVDSERAATLVRRFTRLIEPALIIFFGGFIAFIAAALLQAVYAFQLHG